MCGLTTGADRVSEEGVGMGTDVSFKVKRAGEVIDERRVVHDTEVDPDVARWVEKRLKELENKEDE